MDLKKEVIFELEELTKEKVDLETPKPEFGDYAFPCFELAKKFKRNPKEIANELASKLKKKFKLKVVGGYINFFVDKTFFIKSTLKKALKEEYGRFNKGKQVLIEHTSINPNASPHVGRARNAIIGDAIVKILRFQGYDVETHYYVNDVGKQIAMLVLGCEKLKGKITFDKLLNVYVKIIKNVEKNPKLEQKVFDLLNKLEGEDKKIIAKFKKVVDICVNGQLNVLSKLGIKYDKLDYESKYLWRKSVIEVLKKLDKTGRLFVDKDGRKVLDLKGFDLAMENPVLVLTRGDGTSLYPLRDIAYNIEKLKKAKRNIVVLGEDQKLYFQQIKAALSLIKIGAPEVIHYSFVLLDEKKMSTRKGHVVLLKDFMDKAIKKAEVEIKKRGGKDKKLAEKIGFGALKFAILRVSNEKNVLFDWKKALSFDGESGPYCQYAYARACSILKKAKLDKNVDYSSLVKEGEFSLVKEISKFPDVVLNSELKPYLLANYLCGLAQKFNEFYHICPVLKAENKQARLHLVAATKKVLKNGLNLLGMESPEKM